MRTVIQFTKLEYLMIGTLIFMLGAGFGMVFKNDKDVNNDGKVNSKDYIEIKKEIMQDSCYVDGGWNCE